MPPISRGLFRSGAIPFRWLDFEPLMNLSLTFVVAASSWYLFERPMQRLKRFFSYNAVPAVDAAAPAAVCDGAGPASS
jgi:peptidoglycan/LPS O-acetylase OafA/YrhL